MQSKNPKHARAQAYLKVNAATITYIKKQRLSGVDIFNTAKAAGLLAAKKWIALVDPVEIIHAKIKITFPSAKRLILVEVRVVAEEKKNVEVEAMSAVTTASLVIFDMCKSY